ncbi:hypothetical protein GH714_001136 [Hevea brasiliensis]|uniref:Uncharacterized protein n=1 Tax=Hevea brasiliensis TaxID=3981 RepID=A0A6A6M9R6_HEVBR|nr:hypothetical protein GH714_001136 [Hevea brasiliensis]
MGTIVSKAANGLGGVLANVFTAPFKTILGASCDFDVLLPIVQGGDLSVYRKKHLHFRDIEKGFTSSSESDYSDNCRHVVRKKRSAREGRKFQLQSSRYPSSRYGNHSRHRYHHHHLRLKTREISAHVKCGTRRLRNSRRLQLIKLKNHRRDLGIFKRRQRRGMMIKRESEVNKLVKVMNVEVSGWDRESQESETILQRLK